MPAKVICIYWVFLFVSFYSHSYAAGPDNNLCLLPWPAEVVQGEGKFRLDESFYAALKGPAAGRLFRAAARMLQRLSGRTGIFFSRGNLPIEEPGGPAGIVLECKELAELKLGVDEAYTLVVRPAKIEIKGGTDIGVLHGIETLLQLVMADERGYFLPAISINDRPRFPWRGLLIDSCRHFLPLEVIKRTLEGMAAVKMNVLHWHLTEDQGFRVECRAFPKLHLLGSDGLYYTRAQVKEVIDYAAERGIRVMPEFDIPGHSTSWLVGYPELASAPGPYQIERGWGVKDPTFDPTKKATYKFFKRFFAEMAGLFPDEYMHIGGDENNGKQWSANAKIQAFMKKKGIPDNHALQAHFNKKILAILARYGKKMVGWDEVFQPGLPKSIVIQSWRGQEALVQAAKKGYPTILSNGYYIDLCQPTDYHYQIDPVPGDSPLSEEEKKYILGGEATMWGELISPETIDSRIWPRSAAIAERLWSPARVKDVRDMYRRLEKINLQLEELGLLHIKNQAMMLRRLCCGRDIGPLKVLVDVIEPLKGYERQHCGVAYTQFSPLTRLVDAALPDARVAREFRWQTEEFLETRNKKTGAELKKWLSLWQENHQRLKPIIEKSPILREIEPLSRHLAAAAVIGLQALQILASGQKADKSWVEEMEEILQEARKPQGQAELMIISALEKLLEAAK